MLTSYLLSRTLVTTMARYLLPENGEEKPGNGPWGHFLLGFEHGFERLRVRYQAALTGFIARRTLALTCVALIVAASGLLLSIVGEDFFPSVDAGMMRLHVRAPTGTRIETTEWLVDRIERSIRKIIPPSDLESISDNIGLPVFYDLAFYQTDSIGPQDADIMIELRPGHRPTAMYESRIRRSFAREFPGVKSYFQAADIIAQVLNFGLSAAIDVQVSGNDLNSDYSIAHRLETRMRDIPGVADLRIGEPLDYPAFKVDVDRNKALELGITENQVALSLLTTLAGNSLIQPTFWLDPNNGVNYYVISQAPEHLVNSVAALENIPLSTPGQSGLNGNKPQLLSTPIVELATLYPPRVYADVPQDIAAFVKGGDLATVTVTQYPGRKFQGAVTRHPDALALDTRTMRVEVDLPNKNSALYPGMYATVVLSVSSADDAPRVPDDALIFRNGKTYAPVVLNDRIHLARVSLGNDDGREVEIASGLSTGDLIAVNVSEGVEEGDPVQPVMASGAVGR